MHGTRFVLETDHVALTWLRTVQHSNARLIRTALALQDLDMEIVHKAGVTMHDADALSRLRRKKKGERVPERGVEAHPAKGERPQLSTLTATASMVRC